jgi:hypothetical protein
MPELDRSVLLIFDISQEISVLKGLGTYFLKYYKPIFSFPDQKTEKLFYSRTLNKLEK